MSGAVFTDRNAPPTEEAIHAALGRVAPAWRALFDEIRAAHPDVAATWNYYADGKSWLLKAARGSKTVFWVAVEKNAFRVAFYFPERLVATLRASELSAGVKAGLRRGAPGGKLRRVSIAFGSRQGIRDVMTLIALKRSLK